RKKLEAVQELGYLGAGFRLALKDLEIRGTGNLLGAEQSGHIESIGFDMYMEMLESAVAELRGEKTAPVIEPVIELRVRALIPEDYIENPDLRLSIYRKIASAKDPDSLEVLLDELKDRFGPVTEETKRLIEIMEIKTLAKKIAVTKIQNLAGRIQVLFASETLVNPEKIFSLYKSREQYLKFLPEGGIELDLEGREWSSVYSELKGALEELGTVGAT
ncbi:MAG: transcription-repair coupling factor, partial [Thermodesulfovibrionia bacterium]|nr:transcription-repair coupling factor [Thermodesulfovibrionia bacterium]